MRRMRNTPQGGVIEPVSEGGTPPGRYVGALPATRTAFKQPEVEARAFDELCALLVLVPIATGGQESSRGRLADSGKLQQELVVRSLCKEGEGLVEPEWVGGQGLAQGACEGFDRELVDAISVLEPNAGFGKVREAVEGLRPPLPAAPTGLPLLQAAWTAVAHNGLWSGMGVQEASSGRVRQVVHEWMAFRTRQVDGGAQWMTPLADALLQGHGPLHHAGSSPALRVACNGQEACALEEHVENTVRLCCVGFPGALRPRLAIMADRLAVPETDPVPTAVEPGVEGVPVAPRGFHSEQETSTVIVAQLVRERLRQAPEALTSVGNCQFAAVDRGRRANTGTVLGVPHIDSHAQQVRLLHVCFTLLGGSARLCQAHETCLLI
jgi:hypothetical protein